MITKLIYIIIATLILPACVNLGTNLSIKNNSQQDFKIKLHEKTYQLPKGVEQEIKLNKGLPKNIFLFNDEVKKKYTCRFHGKNRYTYMIELLLDKSLSFKTKQGGEFFRKQPDRADRQL